MIDEFTSVVHDFGCIKLEIKFHIYKREAV